MRIPDAQRAIAADEKVHDYLLNLEHPDGGSKAIWFHSLGYTRADWKHLCDDLLAIARECDEFDRETTEFGVKYKAGGVIGRPDHPIGDHPYRVIVANYGLDRNNDADRIKFLSSVRGLKIPSLMLSMRPMLRRGRRFENSNKNPLHVAWKTAHKYSDMSSDDIERHIKYYHRTKRKVMYAHWLNDMNPHSPVRFATLIEHDWKSVEPNA